MNDVLGRIEGGPFQERGPAIIQNNVALSWAVVIENGQSQSEDVELGPYVLCGILMPPSWTAANITFQVRTDYSAFRDVYTSAGNEMTLTVAASRYVIVDPADFAGCRFLRLRSGTAGTPVAQGAERTIQLVVRPV